MKQRIIEAIFMVIIFILISMAFGCGGDGPSSYICIDGWMYYSETGEPFINENTGEQVSCCAVSWR